MVKKEKPATIQPGQPHKKAAYRAPQIVVYGNIQTLTLTKQKANTSDNPGQEVNMTF